MMQLAVHEQVNQPRPRKRSVFRIGFTLLVVAFSGLLVSTYPQRVWLLGASLGTVAAITVFLRVGWAVPCTIVGTYLGLISDAHIKGGSCESQAWETVHAIVFGTIFGFGVGLFLDGMEYHRTKRG